MRMRAPILGVMLALWGSTATAIAALPAEITVTAPAKLEILRGDKVSGTIALAVGEKLALLDVTESHARVQYRNLTGRVPIAHTDLARTGAAGDSPSATAPASTPVSPRPATAPAPLPKSAPPAAPAHGAATTIARALDGKLVQLEQGNLRPYDRARLAGVKFYGLYFSASWCGPCRTFTPSLVDAHRKIRELYPEFEVVLVSSDQSAADMTAYMRHDHMPWPALRWEAIRSAREITRYSGSGIPCLVLVDENGKVLSDSYRLGRYVGPDKVLDDTWKILRDYRRKHPRATAG